MGEKKVVDPIPVPKEDPPKKEDSIDEHLAKKDLEQKEFAKKPADGAPLPDEDDELTEEEKALKERLELYVVRLQDHEEGIARNAMDMMKTDIRTSTTSMTSIPLPLKFLRPHFSTMDKHFNSMKASENKLFLADILAVLAMAVSDEKTRLLLTYKLQGNQTNVGEWGHEFVRSLSAEIGKEYTDRQNADKSVDDLLKLVADIIPFNMSHNAYYDAVDLLIEVERLADLHPVIGVDNHKQICRYLRRCADYIADPEERESMLKIAFDAYIKHNSHSDAMRVALKMYNRDMMLQAINSTEDMGVKKQLCLMLSTQRIVLPELEDEDELYEIMGNVALNQHFLDLAKELDSLAPKSPEDIYKSHLVEGGVKAKPSSALAPNQTVDSARQNLASSFVNAFVNCGFGKDALITPEGSDWLYKNKTHGMLSATASLGMVNLWDVDQGFNAMDKYTHNNQTMIQAGSYLAWGMLSSGVTSDMNAAFALLEEHVTSANEEIKISAIYGLGLSYAGQCSEEVLDLLVPLMVEENATMEVVAMIVLSLGLVFCGSGNDGLVGSILETFMERSETDLNDPTARIMATGMGLLFIGVGEVCEGTLEAVKAIEHPIGRYLELTIETCSYMGTNNVLQIQKLMSVCSEHFKPSEEDEKDERSEEVREAEDRKKCMHQDVAVIGIAMVAMGEKLGGQMALRALDHLLQFGQVNVRRVVPLALGILSVSNPNLNVMDTLSKLSHDQDEVVSQNAVLSLGVIGAGTNNSRIAGTLRNLAGYYAKEPNHLFLTRIAQGLLHLGKGLMTLDPYSSDRFVMSKVAAAGLVSIMHAALDAKNTILGSSKRHYLLFSTVVSVRPRMLVCVDEEMNPVPVKVRVGTGVDIVGMAGNPRQITGFQSHTTPVLLSHGDRAELSTDEYLALSSVLEGIVIVRKNPDSEYDPEEDDEKKDKK